MGKARKGRGGITGRDGIDKFIEIFAAMVLAGFILWNFQTQITNVKLFSILMTLGGLETYNDTVVGILMLILLVGFFLATRD